MSFAATATAGVLIYVLGQPRTPEAAQRNADGRLRRTLEWIYNLLAQSKCIDCDLADPLVLEFDHIGLKRKNVMDMVWSGFGMDTIQLEMNECEIRCANCHRRKTLADGNSFRHRAGTATRSACNTGSRA